MVRAALVTGAMLLAGCAAPPRALQSTAESPEALATAVLDALARRDEAGLRALMITRDEFEAHVWPKLPASRPETNMSLAFVWNRLAQQSDARLAQTLASYGGRPLTLVAVEFTGAHSDYGTVSVGRESVLTIRDEAGEVSRVKLFGSAVRQGTRYKVFSYVTG
jgi:hypothetical protein